MTIRNFFRKHKTLLMTFVPPLVLLPIPLSGKSQEAKCVYGLLLMAFYWTTETFPVAVTALLPVVLFPMMGISKVSVLSNKYIQQTTFISIGGLAVAIAIEEWNVHKRIALRLLLTMGTTPKWLMLGFMLTTAFLSMWISNTATTSMMIPIAQAVISELLAIRMSRDPKLMDGPKVMGTSMARDQINTDKCKKTFLNEDTVVIPALSDVKPAGGEYETTQIMAPVLKQEVLRQQQCHYTEEQQDEIENLVTTPEGKHEDFDFEAIDPDSQCLRKAMVLSICYAANCGGISTLTGTSTNLVMKGQIDLISDGKSGITFATWFIFSFPVALINLLLAWICLQVVYFGIRNFIKSGKESEGDTIKKLLRSQYESLGCMSFAEKAVMCHFLVLVLCWFTYEPEGFPGWGSLFKQGYVGNAVPAMIISCLLFIFPSSRNQRHATDKRCRTLLDWNIFNRKYPWSVAILLGGGFALAHACKESGLSLWLAQQMAAITGIPTWTMIAVVCLVISFCTEITTNAAVCTIFMPILAELANGTHVNPIYIMLPAAISCSFAFMLPVATPPNTIAYSYGYLRIIDMVKVGWILNILCVVVVTIAINTWGMTYFRLDVYPEWAGLEDHLTVPVSNSTIVDIFNQTYMMTS